jgi:uncharacterized protein (DUF111 family)
LLQQLFDQKLVYDAWFTPIYMKKNRPAALLSVLCHPTQVKRCTALIFKQSSAIGLRYHRVEREILVREFQQVSLDGQQISIKIAYDQAHQPINIAPEYEDCIKAAQALQLPLKEVYMRANQLIRERE